MSRVTLSPKLESVTVYNDSAQLTFSAQMELQPASTMVAVVENIERWGNVDWGTLQLRVDRDTAAAVAAAVMLQNINPVHDVVTEDVREDVQRQLAEIKRIEEEREVCKDDMEILSESCKHIEEIRQYVRGAAFGVPPQCSEKQQEYLQGYLRDPAQWAAMGAFFASRTAAAERDRAALQVKLEAIEERLQEARQRLDDLGGDCGVRTHVKDTLEATLVVGDSITAATPLRLEISCVVSGAGWSPLYDLRVDYAESMLDVFYFANVRQCTSVDWEKVRLRLSTATPHVGGSPPPLWPRWVISTNPLQPEWQDFGGALYGSVGSASASRLCGKDVAKTVAPVLQSAAVEGGGSSSSATVYSIPGLATVRHNNVEVKVTVAHERFPAKLQFVSIPKLDPLTHLSATAVNTTDYEFIAGPSKVFYGNTFVNKSRLNNVSPGEEFQVSLGTDETVKVSRSLVRRGESDKASFFSSNKSQLRFHYAFAVECGALASDAPVTVVVKDNYPVSDDSDVAVSLQEPVPTAGEKPSSVKGATVTVDEDTHEIVWSFAMKKQEKKHFDMVFVAKHPTGKKIFGLDDA